MSLAYATIVYGHYRTFDEGEVDHDLIEKMENEGASSAYGKGRGYTVWYGLDLATIGEYSTNIDVESLKVTVEHTNALRDIIDKVPVSIREELTERPSIFLAWGKD